MNEKEKKMHISSDEQLLRDGHISLLKYFDSRFDYLHCQTETLRKKQEQSNDHKLNMDRILADMERKFSAIDKQFDTSRHDMLERFNQADKRFEQVDKRFEQIDKRFEETRRDMKERFEQVDKRLDHVIESIEKLGNKLDKRDEQHRSFTLRMFTLAISISLFGVLVVFIKTLGMI